MKRALLIIMVPVLLAGGWGLWAILDKKEKVPAINSSSTTKTETTSKYVEYKSAKGVTLRLYEPLEGAAISSPLTVHGEVPGSWSFEASFPVKLVDSTGNLLVGQAAMLQGDWMTEQFVPFSVQLSFTKPASTNQGKLVLQKDNPSGASENEDKVEITVNFK